ncbi:MAG TPA: aspartate aminotransferase family protein [Actinomycetota bacterium]|jgi:glutamate-1-semialdehyde 2,1-aminomutase|nr:aspartate aminotransferase family protein [Actinomycetota bacterium]
MTTTVDRTRLRELTERELARFESDHPTSRSLFERGNANLLAGVPMPWMTEWAGPFPVFVAEAEGARFRDVDGREYVDLCLGDTGAMTGHAPKTAVEAIALQAAKGITLMLPTEDSIWVGAEMQRRFGLRFWQFCLTATDANRFTIRLARAITGRPKILVYNYCYHGSVDETIITIEDGATGSRPGNIGPPVDPNETTRVVEFNDVEALERALAHGDVACVLAEPALTNIGIVLPDDGYHDALRELTRTHGTYLVIDETHCICAGPGGATKAWGLEPDFLTIGKPLASGVPAACYGMTTEVAVRAQAYMDSLPTTDVGGIGGTLSGNALSLSAMRATLETVLTDEAFERMIALGERWADGVKDAIERYRLPWEVQRLGCRAEYWFTPTPPRNGGEAAAADDHELARFTHLYALNRGILLTPFHNMALMSPATTEDDVDAHSRVFAEMCAELVA